MSRLIDADKAVERYSKELHKLIEAGCDPFAGSCEAIRDIMQAFDRQPTAYSVEAVVKELEQEYEWQADTFHGTLNDDALGQMRAYDNAIRIVKRGERNDCV